MSTEKADCPVCGQTAAPAAEVPGRVPPIRTFAIFHCPNCRFSFIASPRTDYETIYSPDYYQGLGADPMVHYLYDHLYPDETLRRYEWQGLVTVFRSLVKSPEQAQWLDYGCGLGSLVRWGRRAGVNISGFDPYAQSEPAREMTEEEKLWKPHLLSPAELAGRTFDFVTSIEVIEHTADPLNFLKSIRPLLKPGGILF
ncbi:MAG: class I SAM-dependent methyltransferase [Deltaproteobacteria bacterium]|jgi:2-polyprenyl-3-methyl-5-hydroxy-6-metoxy-1,4-benzoquinol methylase|nr:class I SAM-dependent methyltransferase [Deltaproteobacteria bacterium]